MRGAKEKGAPPPPFSNFGVCAQCGCRSGQKETPECLNISGLDETERSRSNVNRAHARICQGRGDIGRARMQHALLLPPTDGVGLQVTQCVEKKWWNAVCAVSHATCQENERKTTTRLLQVLPISSTGPGISVETQKL